MAGPPTFPNDIEVFFSYARKDEKLRDQLEIHLSTLKRQNIITGWHDRKVAAGTEWKGQIDNHLESARIVLLLVSADFLASDYCYDVEMKRALERHDSGEARVIPVILRPCEWKETPFGKLQALPRDGKPITDWPKRDKALLNIAEEIRRVVEEISRIPLRGPSSPPSTTMIGRERVPEPSAERSSPLDRVSMPWPVVPSDSSASSPAINTGRLPVPSDPALFVGRTDWIGFLNDAWRGGNPNVVQIVADGGVGKSTIVWHWLEGLRKKRYEEVTQALGWSFYSQGRQDYVNNSYEFFRAAVDHFQPFGLTLNVHQVKNEESVSRAVGEIFCRVGGVMVLDGVEPLQYPPEIKDGHLEDRGVASLLRFLRTAPAPKLGGPRRLLILTTRWPVPGLRGEGLETQILNVLSAKDGASLLARTRLLDNSGKKLYFRPLSHIPAPERRRVVREEFEATATEYGGHALALVLLATFLLRCHDGDLARRTEMATVPDSPGDALYRHARRVMRSYDRMFARGASEPVLQACRQVLGLMGLFDRPAEAWLLDELRQGQQILGLTDGLPDELYRLAVEELRRLHLLAPASSDEDGHLDAHPLVREHFGKVLRDENPPAWCEAHNRLYKCLAELPETDQPDTLTEMEPLFRAVAHGCQAGLHQAAWDEVYWPRIKRGEELYDTRKLDAFGPDLAALSWYFAERWCKLVADFSDECKVAALYEAAFDLRALGRVREAVQPTRTALEMRYREGNWEKAAMTAGDVSLLELTLGNIAAAIKHAKQAVEYARQCSAFESIRQRANLVNALLQAGQLQKAIQIFGEAEKIQEQNKSRGLTLQFPWFYEQLLDLGEYQRVVDLAELPQPARTQTGVWYLESALAHLALGRAYIGFASAGIVNKGYASTTGLQTNAVGKDRRLEQAKDHLDKAVEDFRRAHMEHHLPRGLIARAELNQITSQFLASEVDLKEAFDIATGDPGGHMKLHEADCHLAYARLYIAKSEKGRARGALTNARKMIEAIGYRRRYGAIRELEGLLASK